MYDPMRAAPSGGSKGETEPSDRGERSPVTKTGTTTVAMCVDEGVVLGADQRASLGGRFVTNKATRKIEQVHPTAAVAMSGTVGGLQAFIRTLRAEASLYATRRDEEMSMGALATLAGNVLGDGPYISGPTLAGIEDEPRVFDLDAAGGVLEAEYVAKGSGMQLAHGLLEDEYEDQLSTDAGKSLAARAVASASERDGATGNGLLLATVTTEGIETEGFDAAKGAI